MNLSDLLGLVSTWLDDLNNGYHTVAQLTVYLNQAQREVQKMLIQSAQNYYFKCLQAQLVAGGCEYYLPSDFLKIHRVELVMNKSNGVDITNALTPISLNQQDMYGSAPALPQAYTIVKNRIKFFPVPSEAKTLKLTYSYVVNNMVNLTDVPDVPEQYREMVALLAAKTGFIRDDKPSNELDGKILMYKESLKQDAADRVQQTSRRIITTQNDSGSYLY